MVLMDLMGSMEPQDQPVLMVLMELEDQQVLVE